MLAKVSVVIPIYNSENYLESCILSVLNQSYRNVELILVNDGSTDNSLEICKKYEKPSKVILVDKINNGVSSARNRGIENASGEYLMFVDADDTLRNNAIQILLSNIDKTIDCVIGNFADKYGDIVLERKLRLQSGDYNYEALLPKFIDDGTLKGFVISSSCAALYRKSIIVENNVQFDENVKINEDGLFNFDYALKARRVRVVDKVVYYVRKHEESSSHRRSSCYDFNAPVVKHLENAHWDKKKYNLELQLKRRIVTIALWNIFTYPRGVSFADGVRIIGEITNNLLLIESYQYIVSNKLPLYKKIVFFLMKLKCNYILCFLIQRLLPYLSKHVAR